MITLFNDAIDRMQIDDVIAAVKTKHFDADVHHHVSSNSYMIFKRSYAIVGAASRLGAYCATANDAWRDVLKGLIEA